MKRRLLIAPILVLAILSQACGGNAIHEAKKAAFRIQVITDAAVDTTKTLYTDKVISAPEANKFARLLLKVNTGNRVLITKAEAATADTPAVRADLLAQLKLIEDAVKELKDSGILGIHSKNGELAFASAISALDASLAIIRAALAGGKK